MNATLIEHKLLGNCLIHLSYEGKNNTFMWFVESQNLARLDRSINKKEKIVVKSWSTPVYYILIGVENNPSVAGAIPLLTKQENPITKSKAFKQFIKATKLAGTQVQFKKY